MKIMIVDDESQTLDVVITDVKTLHQVLKLNMTAEQFRSEPGAWSAVLSIDIHSGSEPAHGSDTASALMNLARQYVKEQQDCCIIQGFPSACAENLVIGIKSETRTETIRKIDEAKKSLAFLYKKHLAMDVDFGVSDLVSGDVDPYSLLLQSCRDLCRRLVTNLDRQGVMPASSEKPDVVDMSRIIAAWEIMDYSLLSHEVSLLIQNSVINQDVEGLIWTVNTILLTISGKMRKTPFAAELFVYELSGLLIRILWCRNISCLIHEVEKWLKFALENFNPEKREGQAILKAKHYINNNLNRSISLEDVSREVSMSASYISRLFREKTGITFSEYIAREKIELAKSLLSDPGMKVYEVAVKVGYVSWKHFSRTFKGITGLRPAEYRQNCINYPIGQTS